MTNLWTLFSAANRNADFNPGTLSDLAGQGTHGVEVVVVAALAVIVCALLIFVFRFYKQSRDSENNALEHLTETIGKYALAAEKRFGLLEVSIERIIKSLEDSLGKLNQTITLHGETIAEHEERLDGIDKLEGHDALLAAVKPAAAEEPVKTKKRKNNKKK